MADVLRDTTDERYLQTSSAEFKNVVGGLNNCITLAGHLLTKGVVTPSDIITQMLISGIKTKFFYSYHKKAALPSLKAVMETIVNDWAPAAIVLLQAEARASGALPPAEPAVCDDGTPADVVEPPPRLLAEEASALLKAAAKVIAAYDEAAAQLTEVVLDVAEMKAAAVAMALGMVDVPDARLSSLTSNKSGEEALQAYQTMVGPSSPAACTTKAYLVNRFCSSSKLGVRILGTKLLAQWANDMMQETNELEDKAARLARLAAKPAASAKARLRATEAAKAAKAASSAADALPLDKQVAILSMGTAKIRGANAADASPDGADASAAAASDACARVEPGTAAAAALLFEACEESGGLAAGCPPVPPPPPRPRGPTRSTNSPRAPPTRRW
jgi:hypothetical protein